MRFISGKFQGLMRPPFHQFPTTVNCGCINLYQFATEIAWLEDQPVEELEVQGFIQLQQQRVDNNAFCVML